MEAGEEMFKLTVKLTFLKLIIDHAEKAANGGSHGAVNHRSSPRFGSRSFSTLAGLALQCKEAKAALSEVLSSWGRLLDRCCLDAR